MNNFATIVGNVCSLMAMGSNAFSSTRKTTRGILLVQSLGQVFYGASGIFLKGYSAVVQNVVSILRNLVAMRNISSKIVEWILVSLGVVLGIVFNNRGWIGLLPVVSNLEYTLVVFRVKENERVLKISFMISVILYIVFNLMIYNFVGVISDSIVVATTAIVLIKTRKKAPAREEKIEQTE